MLAPYNMNDHFSSALGPDQSGYQYSDTYSTYPEPDGVQQSYLSSNQLGYQFGSQVGDQFNPMLGQNSDFPRSSHDDLNQFFTDPTLSQMAPSPGPFGSGQLVVPAQINQIPPTSAHINTYGQDTKASSSDPWTNASQTGISLAIVTSGLTDDDDRKTTVQHGQITPGDSPASPAKSPKSTDAKRTKRESLKRKDVTSQTSENIASAPIKKTRKPRKCSKKTITPEQEADKRETFLKRNREAAHKCRIKKKTQNELIVEKAKMLDADNAMKGLQVERLKREIEGLKSLLLPHYRECNDHNLVAYMDASSLRSPDWPIAGLEAFEQPASLHSGFDETGTLSKSSSRSNSEERKIVPSMRQHKAMERLDTSDLSRTHTSGAFEESLPMKRDASATSSQGYAPTDVAFQNPTTRIST